MSVTTSSQDPVAATIDILDGYTTWTNTTPEVYKQSEVSQQERKAASNPRIYVWSPADGGVENLGAEYSRTIDTDIVEASVWILDEAGQDKHLQCKQYQKDIIAILEDYANDNYENTEFHNIRPTSKTDSRSESVARITDHLVSSVQCDFEDLRNSGT